VLEDEPAAIRSAAIISPDIVQMPKGTWQWIDFREA
jgi:hypothetical protein